MAINAIAFAFPGLAGVRCVFQMKTSGSSWQGGQNTLGEAHDADDLFAGNISLSVGDDPAKVVAMRHALRVHCGVDGLAELRQVHGDVTVFDPDPVAADVDPDLPGDGMATDKPGLGLMIKTADCQPLLMAHKSGKYIAALHVGWRGNRIGYPQSAVEAFCRNYDLTPSDVLVVRGPSLGPASAEFTEFESEWGREFQPWFSPARKTMNLWQLTRAQLAEAGVVPGNIFGLDLCTMELPGQFFSYRRSKHCGRQASVIWIDPAHAAS